MSTGDQDLKISAVAAPVREEVARRLRNAIISGRFRPGDRLRERELVEWTSVSRTSVREALRQLESEGLVVMIPNHGPVVAMLTRQEAQDIYEMRELLEGHAGSLFALNANDLQRSELHASVDLMSSMVFALPPLNIREEKEHFYRILFDGAGNAIGRALFESLYARIAMLRSTTLAEPSRPPETIAELRDILTAIDARDGEAARAACVHHVRQAAKVALALISSE